MRPGLANAPPPLLLLFENTSGGPGGCPPGRLPQLDTCSLRIDAVSEISR